MKGSYVYLYMYLYILYLLLTSQRRYMYIAWSWNFHHKINIVSFDIIIHKTDIASSSWNLQNIIKQPTRNSATLLYRIALIAIIQLKNGNKITSESLEFHAVLIAPTKEKKYSEGRERHPQINCSKIPRRMKVFSLLFMQITLERINIESRQILRRELQRQKFMTCLGAFS